MIVAAVAGVLVPVTLAWPWDLQYILSVSWPQKAALLFLSASIIATWFIFTCYWKRGAQAVIARTPILVWALTLATSAIAFAAMTYGYMAPVPAGMSRSAWHWQAGYFLVFPVGLVFPVACLLALRVRWESRPNKALERTGYG